MPMKIYLHAYENEGEHINAAGEQTFSGGV